MKTFLSVLLVFLSVVACADEAMVVHVAKQQQNFNITLASNPTTGYRWIVKNYDKSLFKLLSNQYIAPKLQLIGAGGNVVFTFELIKGEKRPKSSKIELVYKRPWEHSNGTIKVINIRFDN